MEPKNENVEGAIDNAITMKIQDITSTMMWFNRRQLDKLTLPQNLVKGTWRGTKINQLYNLLVAEALELNEELKVMTNLTSVAHESDVLEKIINESADIANFAMFIADVARLRILHNAPAVQSMLDEEKKRMAEKEEQS